MPTPRGPRLVELSHPIAAGMTTYPGQPGPEITAHLTREASRAGYAPGTEFAIERITMIGNTGTYLDSPYHRYPDAVDLAGLPLEALAALPAAVARLTDAADRAIDVDALAALDVPGHAVLLHTGWDRHWGTDRYGRDTPYLTRDAAQWLVDNGARLVAIDSLNIDDPADGARPVPPRILRMGTFPVRAFAAIPAPA